MEEVNAQRCWLTAAQGGKREGRRRGKNNWKMNLKPQYLASTHNTFVFPLFFFLICPVYTWTFQRRICIMQDWQHLGWRKSIWTRLNSTYEIQVSTNDHIFNVIRQLPCVQWRLLAFLNPVYIQNPVLSGIMYTLKCDKKGWAVEVEGDLLHICILWLLISWTTHCSFPCLSAQWVAGAQFPLVQNNMTKA